MFSTYDAELPLRNDSDSSVMVAGRGATVAMLLRGGSAGSVRATSSHTPRRRLSQVHQPRPGLWHWASSSKTTRSTSMHDDAAAPLVSTAHPLLGTFSSTPQDGHQSHHDTRRLHVMWGVAASPITPPAQNGSMLSRACKTNARHQRPGEESIKHG
jgi:hypothetical protein